MRKTSPIAVLLVLGLTACGGGGGGSTPPPAPRPPTALAYALDDALYRAASPIAPNVADVEGGTPTSWSASPALPTGLSLDDRDGTIHGTPVEPSAPTPYAITASNAAGSASTVVTIEVRWPEASSLHPQEALDDGDLRHFLRRTHWSVRELNRAVLEQVGLETYLEAMLEFPPVGSTPHEAGAAPILVNENDPPGQEGMFPNQRQLSRWWLTLMVTNPNTFQEVLAFFWHDHFATSSVVLGRGNLHWMKDHVEIFRGEGAGNVRELLLRVSRDPAMLRWLDGVTSTGNLPNENYAREYLELFSLGVDAGYTQDDILEAARAFTGYRITTLDSETGLLGISFDPRRHDPDDKFLFGVRIPGQNETDDYEAVVDITMQQRDVAGWIARALLRYFCVEDPAPELLDQLAAELRSHGYEIAPTLRTLFRSEAFFSDEARGAFVASPVETSVGFINATGLVIHPNELEYRLDTMSQVPTRPPTVDGWPEGEQWLSAQGLLGRANLTRSCIANRSLQAALGIDVRALLPEGTPSAEQVVDALTLLLGVEPTFAERDLYVEYLDTERLPSGEVVDSPFDVTNETHVDDRVRGLLYVLGQHPQAAKR